MYQYSSWVPKLNTLCMIASLTPCTVGTASCHSPEKLKRRHAVAQSILRDEQACNFVHWKLTITHAQKANCRKGRRCIRYSVSAALSISEPSRYQCFPTHVVKRLCLECCSCLCIYFLCSTHHTPTQDNSECTYSTDTLKNTWCRLRHWKTCEKHNPSGLADESLQMTMFIC